MEGHIMFLKSLLSAIAITVLTFSNVSAEPLDAQEIFLSASSYTVKVKARIETPFIEDDVGVFDGAGFLIDAERGWILTNAHVVGRSPAMVSLAFQNSTFVDARKLYVDPHLDIAILEIDAGNDARTAAPLECDDTPSVGHPVGAFGHPWGLEFTGTRGIVSGVTTDFGETFIRMDAAINPGNSGGPLISLSTGRVLGISVASSGEEDDQNTNFAVPIVFVCRIIEILKSGGDPSPPRLPVVFLTSLRDRDALIVARTYLPEGLLDLRPGDEIVGDPSGNSIFSETQLIDSVRGQLDEVHLDILREGQNILITGRLDPEPLITERAGILVSGLLIGRTTKRDSAVLGTNNGLMVHNVEWGSVGDDLGFNYRDILTTIDGRHYDDPEVLFMDLQEAQDSGHSVSVEILRFHEGEAIFGFLRRELLIEDLEVITGQ
jgi:serine protease Do